MAEELSSEDQEQADFGVLVVQSVLAVPRPISPEQHVGWDLVRKLGKVLVEPLLQCSFLVAEAEVVVGAERNRSWVGVVYQRRFVDGVEPSSLVGDHLLGDVGMVRYGLIQEEEALNCTSAADSVEMVGWRREMVAMHILESDMDIAEEELVDVVIVAYVDAVIAGMDSAALVSA